jgi:hypothetical protein
MRSGWCWESAGDCRFMLVGLEHVADVLGLAGRSGAPCFPAPAACSLKCSPSSETACLIEMCTGIEGCCTVSRSHERFVTACLRFVQGSILVVACRLSSRVYYAHKSF